MGREPEVTHPPTQIGPSVTDEPDDDTPPTPHNGIAVAYVYQQAVEYSWHHSIIEMIGWDLARSCHVMQGGYVAIHHGTDGLVQARNLAVKTFLEERPMADWMLWIDTDMGFAPDTADRLWAAADPVSRPVVGALCFAQRQVAPDGFGGWTCLAQPTLFDYRQVGEQQGFTPMLDYPEDQIVPVKGTGSACILIHRSAFERVYDRYGMTWYSRIPNPTMGEVTSEDLSFCMRLGSLEIPVHVHTGVRTSHAKSVWVSEREYRAQRVLGLNGAAASPLRGGTGVAGVPDGVRVRRTAVVSTDDEAAHVKVAAVHG